MYTFFSVEFDKKGIRTFSSGLFAAGPLVLWTFCTPDLSLPGLSRPGLSSPDLSSPELSRPDLSRPDVLWVYYPLFLIFFLCILGFEMRSF